MIFVTGATGFLGRNLVPLLASQGYSLRALVRQPDHHPWLRDYNVEVVQGDLRDGEIVRRAVAGCRYVAHAAGRFRMWGNSAEFERINIEGSANVMLAAVRAGVEKFIHISTIAVVGNPLPGLIIDETHSTRPVDPYQKSKLAGEQAALKFCHEQGLPVVVLRPGAFYGPHGRYAFNRLFFEDPLKGLLVKVGGGNYITFPVFVGDVAAAVSSGLTCGRAGEIYNICGDPLTHNEANDIFSEEAGITHFRINAPEGAMIAMARVWTWLSRITRVEPYYPINLRWYIFNNWQASSQKARDELHFHPTPFREGVRRTLAWYREMGFRWAG